MENGDRPVTGCGEFFLNALNKDQTNNGLTKREHFAGLAMQGFLAGIEDTDLVAGRAAFWAVETADALLKELEKEK